MAVEALHTTILVGIEHDVVRIDACGKVSGDVSMLLTVDHATLVIAVDETSADPDSVLQEKWLTSVATAPIALAPVDSDALKFLQELSLRTTVPSSAASRANAGAVTSDND